MSRLRIGLDLDDTVNYWFPIYLKKFGTPKNDAEISKNVFKVLKNDKNFWINLPVKNRPNFEVTLYCTKRINSKNWTREWLRNNNIQIAPIYQVYCQSKNKADLIKGLVDVFIDDSIRNFEQLNNSGIPCLLMDTDWNRNYDTPYRITSLDYYEIKNIYNNLINDLNGIN